MKIVCITRWVSCLLLTLCVVSCGKKEYVNLIPKDAALVMTVNLESLIKEAGGPEEVRKLASRADLLLLKSFASAPEETGVDLGSPAYLFASLNRDEPTLLMGLKDTDALEQWLGKLQKEGACEKIQRRGDFSWTVFTGQGYCVFTEDMLMWVYAPLTPPETVLDRLAQLMKQEEEDSFVSTEPYGRLKEMKAGISFYLSLSTLPNASEVSSMLGIPFTLSVEDLRMLGSVAFNKEKLSLTAHYYSENKELEDFLEKQSLDLHALSMQYFEYIPENVMACVAMKLDGDGYAKVGKWPGVGDLISNLARFSGIDAERFLDSFSGDFTIALRSMEEGIPQLIWYAGTMGNGTRELLKEGLGRSSGFFGPAVRTIAPDQYAVHLGDVSTMQLGVEKESFYLLTGSASPFVPVPNPLSKSKQAGLQGKLISYIYINTERMEGSAEMAREYIGDKVSVLSKVRTVELAVRPDCRLDLNIYFRAFR